VLSHVRAGHCCCCPVYPVWATIVGQPCNSIIIWPLIVECEVKLATTEMSVVRWTCSFTLKERKRYRPQRIVTSQVDDSEGRVRWFGHVECKDDTDPIRHCTAIED